MKHFREITLQIGSWLGSYSINGFKTTDKLYCKNESQSLFHTMLQKTCPIKA